jgi:phosphopantothenoylcysteine decarboxylase / phosphopantothenate---cysteine ligase
LNEQGAGFGYDTNKVLIIKQTGEKVDIPLQSKQSVAHHIIQEIGGILKSK